MRRGRSVLWAFLMVLMLVAAACQQGGGDDTPDDVETQAQACDPSKLKPATASLSAQFAGVSRGPLLAQAKPTLTIGAYGDRTGANSQIVVPSHEGEALAIKQANEKGDLPVTLVHKPIDNKDAKSDTAPAIAQQFIGDKSVIAVLGGGFSGETEAVGGLFKEANLLLLTPSATRTSLTAKGFTTFFRGVASDDDQGSAVIQVFEHLDCKKIAIVDDKTPYGQGLADVAAKAAAGAGLEVVLDEGIEPTTDYTSLVDSILSKDPEGVFYSGYASEFQLVAKQLRDKGYEGVIASGDGSKEDKIGEKIGVAESENIILTCPCPDINLSKDPAAKAFVKAYKAEYNKDPGIYAAEGYDVANVTIEAIRECGKSGAAGVTRECVVEKVRASKYKGVTKTFIFEPNGQVKTKDVSIFVIRGGAIKEVGLVNKLT